MTEAPPLITVITVCRNPGAALLRTLQSVREQTGVAWEQVVVDGASTDGTPAFLTQWKESPLRFVSEPDTGIYDAMNKAVRLARGQWIIFLNAGDSFIASNSLSNLATHAQDGVDHVAARMFFYWPDGASAPFTPHGLAYPPLHMPVFHPATLSRRMRLLRRPFDPTFRIAGDMDFFLHEMIAGANFTFIPDLVSRFNLDGISSTRRWDTNRESRRTIRRHTRFSPMAHIILECRLLAWYMLGPLFMAMRHARARKH